MDDFLDTFQELEGELNFLIQRDSFKQFGFAQAHENYQWLKRVTDLKEYLHKEEMTKEEELVWNLQSMGLSYATSKGEKSESVQKFKDRIEELIEA